MARIRVAAAAVFLVACHHAAPAVPSTSPAVRTAARAATLTGAPCRSPDVGEGWREVRGPDFSFCVPADWKPRDAASGRDWVGPGAELHWGTAPREVTITTREVVVTRAPDGSLDTGRGSLQEMNVELQKSTEVIGGRTALVTFNHVGGTYYVSAAWTTPTLNIHGTARSTSGAALLAQMVRATRFAADSAADHSAH